MSDEQPGISIPPGVSNAGVSDFEPSDLTLTTNWSGRASSAVTDAPAVISHYHLGQILGKGGMGIVYKAEQFAPIKRTVALKLVRTEYDARHVMARFDAERQALARMDHPHIAKVLDAGADPLGRPFFVMEFVPGIPIAKFCDENLLSIPDRLHLFLQVCDAISHAHTKAILHRDIKSSNVLAYRADGVPTVKVIDFGIAKAMSDELLNPLLDRTIAGRAIGTYESMSPEQAQGDTDVDTRTDVYALGVLLYELLCGSKPLAHAMRPGLPDLQLQRIILEQQPPRPSDRLSAIDDSMLPSMAQARKVESWELVRVLRSELEWIPMKAIRKERERRYSSAGALGDDIRNYLANRPLLAGPDSRRYRVGKFVRRNRGAICAAMFILTTLILGIAGTTAGFLRESHQRKIADAERATAELQRADALAQRKIAEEQKADADRQRGVAQLRTRQAEDQRDNAKAVVDFITINVMGKASPKNTPDKKLRDTLVSAVLEPAEREVKGRFIGKPQMEAAVRNSLALMFDSLGRPDLALPDAQAAYLLWQKSLGDDAPDTIQAMSNLARILTSVGQFSAAEPLARKAVDQFSAHLGDEHASTVIAINTYLGVLLSLGRSKEAEPEAEKVWQQNVRVFGPEDFNTVESLDTYALILRTNGNYTKAEPLARQAWELSEKVMGPNYPDTIFALNNYGVVLESVSNLPEAAKVMKLGLDRSRVLLGENHPATITAMANYASVLGDLGRFDEAEPLSKESLNRTEKLLGPNHPDTLDALNNYALLLNSMGRSPEAKPLAKKAWDQRCKVLGEDSAVTLVSASNYALVLQRLGEFSAAEDLFFKTLEKLRRVQGENHPDTLRALNNYAYTIYAEGDFVRAGHLFKDACDRFERVFGPRNPETLNILNNYGAILIQSGEPEQAMPVLKRTWETGRDVLGEKDKLTILSRNNYGRALLNAGHADQAEPVFYQCWKLREQVLGPDSRETIDSMSDDAMAFAQMKDYAKAATLFGQAYESRRIHLGYTHPDTAVSLNQYLDVLPAAGKTAVAEAVLKDAIAGTLKSPPVDPARVAGLDELLGKLMVAQRKGMGAIDAFTDALENRRAVHPADPLKIASLLTTLGRLLTYAGDNDKAEKDFNEALEIRKTKLGPADPATRATALSLAELLDHIARHDDADKVRADFGLPASSPATAPLR